jgi:hypothetical protein
LFAIQSHGILEWKVVALSDCHMVKFDIQLLITVQNNQLVKVKMSVRLALVDLHSNPQSLLSAIHPNLSLVNMLHNVPL